MVGYESNVGTEVESKMFYDRLSCI